MGDKARLSRARRQIQRSPRETVVMGTGHHRAPYRSRHRADPVAAAKPGEHVWVIATAYHLTDVLARQAATDDGSNPVLLDVENLLTFDGPGCYVCEQMWTEQTAVQPCPGEPNEGATR